MKKKGPFEWTPEAEAAFQDLKKYLTSPLVMVAPCPLEPLVLYLAAMPHSASAVLVVVREERLANGSRTSTPHPIKMQRHQDDAPEASTAPTDDPAPQYGAPEASAAPMMSKILRTVLLRARLPQRMTKVQDPTNTSALVEHPVYFFSTMLHDARACYPMPQKLLLMLLVASRKLRHYFQGHPIKVVSAYPLERVL